MACSAFAFDDHMDGVEEAWEGRREVWEVSCQKKVWRNVFLFLCSAGGQRAEGKEDSRSGRKKDEWREFWWMHLLRHRDHHHMRLQDTMCVITLYKIHGKILSWLFSKAIITVFTVQLHQLCQTHQIWDISCYTSSLLTGIVLFNGLVKTKESNTSGYKWVFLRVGHFRSRSNKRSFQTRRKDES